MENTTNDLGRYRTFSIDDLLAPPNLELIINGIFWNVVHKSESDTGKGYWTANTSTHTLTIYRMAIDAAKYECWLQYHDPLDYKYFIEQENARIEKKKIERTINVTEDPTYKRVA